MSGINLTLSRNKNNRLVTLGMLQGGLVGECVCGGWGVGIQLIQGVCELLTCNKAVTNVSFHL